MAIQQENDLFDDVPSGAGSPVDPGQYLVKCTRLQRLDDGQFGKRIAWHFNLADAKTRTPMYGQDGDLYEFRHVTSGKLGPKAKAREFAEALLGRELAVGESGADVAKEVVGKKALAIIGPNERDWTEIIRMTPYKEKAAPAKSAAVAALEEDVAPAPDEMPF